MILKFFFKKKKKNEVMAMKDIKIILKLKKKSF